MIFFSSDYDFRTGEMVYAPYFLICENIKKINFFCWTKENFMHKNVSPDKKCLSLSFTHEKKTILVQKKKTVST